MWEQKGNEVTRPRPSHLTEVAWTAMLAGVMLSLFFREAPGAFHPTTP